MFCRLVSRSCFNFRPVYTAVNTTIRDTATKKNNNFTYG